MKDSIRSDARILDVLTGDTWLRASKRGQGKGSGVIMICLAVLVVVLGLAQGADVRAIALEKHNAYR